MSDLQFRFEGQWGSHFNYVFIPQFRWSSGDEDTSSFEFLEDGKRRPNATFKEASLGWSSGAFEVSIGKSIFNWGVADAWNPVDDLNPWDFLDVPTAERIGVPALSLYYLHDLFEIQGVWQPFFTPSRIALPGMENRWLPDPRPFVDGGPPFTDFAFGGRDLPAHQWDHGQFGLRLTSSTLIDGWDLGLTYFRGNQSAGVFRAQPAGTTLVAELEYPRYHQIGMSFATVMGPWQIHGEGAYHDTDDGDVDDDYIEYIVGINRSFSSPVPFLDEAIVVLEYAGQEVTTAKAEDSAYFGSRQFLRPFEDALVGSLTLKFSDDTEAELFGAYDFADGGSFYGAHLSHKFNDYCKAKLGGDFFAGPGDSFFGKWGSNDRFFLSFEFNL